MQRRQLAPGFHLEHRDVGALVAAEDLRRQSRAVVHDDGDVRRFGDDVVVGDDVSGLVDDEAGALRVDLAFGLLLRIVRQLIEEVAEVLVERTLLLLLLLLLLRLLLRRALHALAHQNVHIRGQGLIGDVGEARRSGGERRHNRGKRTNGPEGHTKDCCFGARANACRQRAHGGNHCSVRLSNAGRRGPAETAEKSPPRVDENYRPNREELWLFAGAKQESGGKRHKRAAAPGGIYATRRTTQTIPTPTAAAASPAQRSALGGCDNE